MDRRSDYVFGYGSLAGELPPGGSVALLHGYRRVWGVAADNEHAIPGYKRYLLRADGSTPRVFVAFLDLAEDPDGAVNGVLAPADAEALARLDRRERNYDRVEVTPAIDHPPDGRVWTYVGSAEGRARLEAGRRDQRLVVARAYAESVHAAFRRLGDREYRRFLASSDLDGVPLLDFERVDLPPAEPTA
ncbi:MAG TPA: gamma-glutamylcyclotransferase family protein [Thermoleophilaceae bacterium]|nr:gamma-glutamylcyclotransferase family protein [Thermoleophilaceae bacterium]